MNTIHILSVVIQSTNLKNLTRANARGSPPPPKVAHVAVKRADHYTHEVFEHEHELAKLNGCHGKAHYNEAAQHCKEENRLVAKDGIAAAGKQLVTAEKSLQGDNKHQSFSGHVHRGNSVRLPPLHNPPRQPGIGVQ